MSDAVKFIADAVRKQREPGVLAILAYGSCLRNNTTEGLIDLYVLTDGLWSISRTRLACLFGMWLPPNVHYYEAKMGEELLRAKVAVMPLSRFRKLCRYQTKNPYIWARFGQPCRIVYVRSIDDRSAVEKAIEEARASLWRNAAEVSHAGEDSLEALARLLRMSYATELRPEDETRALKIIKADETFYQTEAATRLGPHWQSHNEHPKSWRTRRLIGRGLSLARLIKAAFTFQGGADYMAWKIARHSGVHLEITPWQRRHPVLGAITLLPQILKKKAIR